MSTTISTVHVVEDEPAVLRSLTRLLSNAGLRVRGYQSPHEFLSQFDREASGCVVLDLCLPGMTGLDLQEQLTRKGCVQPVVFVTGNADVSASVRAMRAGALHFLIKPVEAQALLDCVHEALRRSAVDLRKRIDRSLVQQRAATLTPRERQVFEGVVNGMMNKQIAANFGVSEKTIKVHRGRVMHKMGAQTVAQLVRMSDQMSSPAPESLNG
ncbi:MAG TPA: response regulator [Steroidobacter sp.]|uniref:response regulator transcription factor n=1 Tax=Steroidobacter sp. TaxID=1978227 RepID=UPI002ED9E73C